MVTACKATVPTITDQASAMQLSQCAKNLASALAELRTAAQKVNTLFMYHKHMFVCFFMLAVDEDGHFSLPLLPPSCFVLCPVIPIRASYYISSEL